MDKIKLKLCPFCGGKAKMCKDNYNKYMVVCACGLMIGIELEDTCELVDGWRALFDTFDEAAEAWNRRNGADNNALKLEYEGDGYDDNGEIIYDTAYCPNCRNEYEVYYDYHDNYCRKRGQKLDWEVAVGGEDNP